MFRDFFSTEILKFGCIVFNQVMDVDEKEIYDKKLEENGLGDLAQGEKRSNMLLGMIVSKRKDALRRINIVRNFL